MTALFSVVLVTRNNLQYTARCMESLRRHSPPETELVLVDNGSTDGTRSYLAEIAERGGHPAKTVFFDQNEGWCRGVNAGLEIASGTYLVLLNNDVVVTPDWLVGLRACMDHAPEFLPGLRRVGLVGPVSNSVGGPQQVANPPPADLGELDVHAHRHRLAFDHNWGSTFFLSGFCLMIHRECYREVGGLDPLFSPGGFDDNDLLLRAQERGWDAAIAGDVYVHHEGGVTFRTDHPDRSSGLANRSIFHRKWRERRAGKTRLVAAYRVKNGEATLGESLDATARFADAIVVLDDGSTDGTKALCERHAAVTRYERQDLPFDERRDRNRVLSMAEELGADWVIAIDADEVFEMSRAQAVRLMQLADPHVKALGFHWYTFWEPTRSTYRSDGVFGDMAGYRMYKVEPGLRLVGGTEQGLHCGNIPQFPDGATRFTNIRVKHFGYENEELRQNKLAFYRRIDPAPRIEMVGSRQYEHLVSPTVSLRRYEAKSGVSLCLITRNEEERLEGFLASLEPFVDEICVVDNGSRDLFHGPDRARARRRAGPRSPSQPLSRNGHAALDPEPRPGRGDPARGGAAPEANDGRSRGPRVPVPGRQSSEGRHDRDDSGRSSVPQRRAHPLFAAGARDRGAEPGAPPRAHDEAGPDGDRAHRFPERRRRGRTEDQPLLRA
jgi:GT2 family glycosyltransferase